MYCKNCGAPVGDGASVCVKCGYTVGNGQNFCAMCGAPVQPGASVCTQCGAAVGGEQFTLNGQRKSKLAAGLLGIFLGGWGVHNFYLGYTGRGVAQILLNFCCGIGAIWGFIEGVLILAGSIDRDANGIPLKE